MKCCNATSGAFTFISSGGGALSSLLRICSVSSAVKKSGS